LCRGVRRGILGSVEIPDVRYTRSGDVAIAYQVVGDGSPDVVFLPFLSNLYTLWQFPHMRASIGRLADAHRLIVVNTRGMGMSDRPRGITVEARVDDVRAAMDAVGSARATVFGLSDTSSTAVVFAATYPERVDRLILFLPTAKGMRSPDYPWGWSRDEWLETTRTVRERWGERELLEEMAKGMNPQWADDPEYLDVFVWHHRLTSSPMASADFQRMLMEIDVTDVLPVVRVPTLVISKAHTREEGEWIASQIPDAQHVVVPGIGWAPFEGSETVEAVEAFVGDRAAAEVPDTVLATLLFTDLVGSTRRAAELGDRAWRALLEEHRRVVRRELARYRGAELDTAGDGFFASFDGPARAIACGRAVVETTRELGLELRAGVHTGECERSDGKLAGLAVHVGARVLAAAGPGDVVVSGTVRDLVAGSPFEFDDLGERELAGVPGRWRLHRVVP
jgi:class 3 adenylate cyclase